MSTSLRLNVFLLIELKASCKHQTRLFSNFAEVFCLQSQSFEGTPPVRLLPWLLQPLFNFMRMHIITLCINPGVLGNCPHLYFPVIYFAKGRLSAFHNQLHEGCVWKVYFIKVACLDFCLFDFPHPTPFAKKQPKVCGLFIRSNVIRSPFLSTLSLFLSFP